jgi:hypothetical protein
MEEGNVELIGRDAQKDPDIQAGKGTYHEPHPRNVGRGWDGVLKNVLKY